MSQLRAWFLLNVLAASVNAAGEKPFMSRFNPPAQPIPLDERWGYESALMKPLAGCNPHLAELNLARGYAAVSGINRDPRRLSAGLGSADFPLAAPLFALAGSPLKPENDELATAVECRERGGLPNFFAKLRAGPEVRIAYLGGSITAQDGWRPKSLNWFRERFPAARMSEINAAIGGTGSDLGVFRVGRDALDHHPDLLFVEFAVNDDGAPPRQILRCMEGIVRQTWRRDPKTDICFVYTLAGDMLQTLQAAHFPRSATAMEQVADHYAIPSIHLGVEVARLEKAGKLIFKGDLPKTDAEKLALGDKILFSPDAVHPYTDTGHQLYLEAIARSVPKLEKAGQAGNHALGPPLVADNWERAKMIPLSKAALSPGWRRLDPMADPLAKAFSNRLPELWKASRPGDSIAFRFRGATLRIYDLLGPDCGQVSVSVDGGKPEVKPRFDAYCTYHRLATLSIAEGMAETVHTVSITVHPEQPDKAKILSQRGEKIDDPKRFDGTAWYAGALLMIGDLVE